jgi:hypothetical protein
MNFLKNLRQEKNNIVKQIAEVGTFRKGTLNNQFLKSSNKDGQKPQHGPYCVYTFKKNNKTVSKRIKTEEDKEKYQKQIDNFRKFQELITEYVETNQELADMEINEDKKKLQN